jgi:hypothetical protein
MANISKKLSLTTTTLSTAVFAFLIITAIGCSDSAGREKGEWIPTPPDTSALGKIDHFIPIERMDEFKKLFAAEKDSILRAVPGLSIPNSEAFNKEWLLKVLKDPKCVGIRIYYGTKKGERGEEFRLMIVGVDEQGNDLYITREGSTLANQADDPGGKGGLEWGNCDPPCNP